MGVRVKYFLKLLPSYADIKVIYLAFLKPFFVLGPQYVLLKIMGPKELLFIWLIIMDFYCIRD